MHKHIQIDISVSVPFLLSLTLLQLHVLILLVSCADVLGHVQNFAYVPRPLHPSPLHIFSFLLFLICHRTLDQRTSTSNVTASSSTNFSIRTSATTATQHTTTQPHYRRNAKFARDHSRYFGGNRVRRCGSRRLKYAKPAQSSRMHARHACLTWSTGSRCKCVTKRLGLTRQCRRLT